MFRVQLQKQAQLFKMGSLLSLNITMFIGEYAVSSFSGDDRKNQWYCSLKTKLLPTLISYAVVSIIFNIEESISFSLQEYRTPFSDSFVTKPLRKRYHGTKIRENCIILSSAGFMNDVIATSFKYEYLENHWKVEFRD